MSAGRAGIPRVTLGIATYNRDTYLGEAVASCLSQDYASLEVLVVLDGTTNPAVEEILARFTPDPRLRIVRHETNRGISAAYNTIVEAGSGQLIAMLGDDDVCLPGRIRRQVEIFDRFPDTGVVHGDAQIIDGRGSKVGDWHSGDLPPAQLVQSFYRRHNYLIDPTRMVDRRVYERVGGYDARFRTSQDFEFWLRAARHFRFRHCAGTPLIALRRHEDNGSGAAHGDTEAAEVQLALTEALERFSLPELVPELDWSVLEPAAAERQALLALARHVVGRAVPAPELAARLRAQAAEIPPVPAPTRHGGRLLMTMFGFNDSGGGTLLPRLIAKDLVRRGWAVTVFYAATAPLDGAGPYAISEAEQDGVRLVGVHNRPHGLLDLGHPERELDDPPIREAFAREIERSHPDVVHFHNLHNLGASLIDVAAAYGLPTFMTTHNHWLLCPRNYMVDGEGRICAGPGDGSRCAACVGSANVEGHHRRLQEIRESIVRAGTTVLAVSDPVRRTLLAGGYPSEAVDVVHQAMPHEHAIWTQLGERRQSGRRGDELTVGFIGSVYPHKGPHLLVQAAQRTRNAVRVRIHGEVDPRVAETLRRLDRRGVVDLLGAYSPSELPGLLAQADVAALPSTLWETHNLAAEECHAARLPLIVPRLGGLGETVRDGVDGLTFTPLDIDDLAHQLDRLAGEPGLLERLQDGIEAPARFADHLDELEARYLGRWQPPAGLRDSTRPPAVRWQGDHGLPTSLSIINTRVTERLTVAVQRIAADGVALDPPLPHAADVEVRHQWPPDFSLPVAGHLALIQPWEFGAIPESWIEPLQRRVDELWVPSEYVRGMYLTGGIAPDRVHVVPNGVDLDTFSPAAEPPADAGRRAVRFLFVGGLIPRKGPDLLFDAFIEAFAGRDDVSLVVKDFGADGIYRDGDRARFAAHAAAGALPRIELIDATLDDSELAELYRSCDVLVAPYRGEGFCMPALEAMACALPVITTAGGPTDEFVPEAAGWRIASSRRDFPEQRVSALATHGRPWMLEPDSGDLVRCLRAACDAGDQERRAKGAHGRRAAERLSWDAVAAAYRQRLAMLAAAPLITPIPDPYPLQGDSELRVLGTPAWHGEDRLSELLRVWGELTTPETSACLYLLANPAVDGTPEALEARVLAAAAAGGLDLGACADIDVVMSPARAGRDASLHATVDVYVPLHAACAGHVRMARAAGRRVLAPAELAGALERAPVAAA